MVDIVTSHVEEIERRFRNQLSPQAIEIIIRMHEETRMLQRAVNDQTLLINMLKDAMAVSMKLTKQMNEQIKKFEHKYTDQYQGMVRTEND